jgi:hypothetical protein
MSGIAGKKREVKEFSLRVGVGEVEVVAVNPDREDLCSILGRDIEKDPEYIGEKDVDGVKVKTARISFYVKDKNSEDGKIDQVTFFLEDRDRMNKNGDKFQYINSVGTTTWGAKESDLAAWFTKRDYRVAKTGEGELYEFLQAWLSKLDYRDAETTLTINWEKLMKGNVKELREQINGEYQDSVTVGFTVRNVEVVDKDTEEKTTKQYQAISNKAFCAGFNFKFFKTRKFTPEVLEALREKKPKDLKAYEKFALKLVDKDYGIKDHFILDVVQEYDSSKDLASSDAVITEDGDDY